MKGLEICRGQNGSTDRCSGSDVLDISWAHWGRFRRSTFCGGNAVSSTCGSSNTLSLVKSFCQGKNTCFLSATTAIFGTPCPSGQEYLMMDYECVAGPPTTTTTAALTTESESTAAAVTTMQSTAEPTTDFTTTLQSTAEPTTDFTTTLQSTAEPTTDFTTTLQSTAAPTTVPVTTLPSTLEPVTGPVTTPQSTAQSTNVHGTTSQSTAEPTASLVTNTQSTVEPTIVPVTKLQSTSEPATGPVTTPQSTAQSTNVHVTTSQSTSEPTAYPVTNTQSIAEPTAIPVMNSQSVVEPTAKSGTTKERATTLEFTEAAGSGAAMSSASLGGLVVGIFVVLVVIALVLLFRKNKVYAHEFHKETSEQAVENGRDDSTVGEKASLISETARELSQVTVTSKSGHDVNNSVKSSSQEASLSQLFEAHHVSDDGSELECLAMNESREIAISDWYLDDEEYDAIEDKCHEAQVRSSQESVWTYVSIPASQVKKSASAENLSESGKDALKTALTLKSTTSVMPEVHREHDSAEVERSSSQKSVLNHSDPGKDVVETALSLKSTSSVKSEVHIEHDSSEVERSPSQKSVLNHTVPGKDAEEPALSLKSASSVKSDVPIEHPATGKESSLSQKSAAELAAVDCQPQGVSLHDSASSSSIATGEDSTKSKAAMQDSAVGQEKCD